MMFRDIYFLGFINWLMVLIMNNMMLIKKIIFFCIIFSVVIWVLILVVDVFWGIKFMVLKFSWKWVKMGRVFFCGLVFGVMIGCFSKR